MKNKAAQQLGRQGGLKGGRARAVAMTPEERSESARVAARARWDNHIPPITTTRGKNWQQYLNSEQKAHMSAVRSAAAKKRWAKKKGL